MITRKYHSKIPKIFISCPKIFKILFSDQFPPEFPFSLNNNVAQKQVSAHHSLKTERDDFLVIAVFLSDGFEPEHAHVVLPHLRGNTVDRLRKVFVGEHVPDLCVDERQRCYGSRRAQCDHLVGLSWLGAYVRPFGVDLVLAIALVN